jgi:hypothetical protein
MTDRHSPGCAPSTPERACFLAPDGKNRSPATRRSARAARRTGHRFCRPLLGARYGVSGPQPVSWLTDIRRQKERRRRARPDPDSEQPGAGAAGRRRVSAVPKAEGGQQPAHEREQGKDRDAEAGHSRLRRWLRRGRQDGQTAEGGKEEAAGGRFRAKEAAIRSKSPPSIRSVQRGCPPTAPRRTAEAQHAASVRAQAARPSAAPCQARRPAGRGV